MLITHWPRRFRWHATPWRDARTTLAVLLALAAGLSAFFWLTGEVMEGDTGTFDRTILLALQDAADPTRPLGPHWLETAARDVTSLGSVTVLTLVSVCVAGFLLLARARLAALQVAAAMGGGEVLSTLLKHACNRPRPDLVPHMVEVSTASFPSGHAMLSAIAGLTLGAMLARLPPARPIRAYVLAGAILVPLLIGLSRVYLGVHWPTDVLAGWCAGACWALLCWGAVRRAERRCRPPDGGAFTACQERWGQESRGRGGEGRGR